MGAENGVHGAMPNDERVDALRAEMAKANIDAYIIPSEEPHMVGLQAHMPTQYQCMLLQLARTAGCYKKS